MKEFVTVTHQKQCIESIKQLVAFPSVCIENEDGTPFGKHIQAVLEYTIALCNKLGFHTFIDPLGYYGYAEIGSGTESVAILCHLDVVPQGDVSKWHTLPFEGVIKGERMYGRGIQDDKGPSMAALYAVKSLMDSGVVFKRRVRFIFGTDEETLWRCMNRYNEMEEQATMGFAPDSTFPLIYAEKGLLQVKLHGKGSKDIALSLGEAFNIVPSKATYCGQYSESVKNILDKLQYDYIEIDNGVIVLGVAKHSKDAPKGVNAISRLVEALSTVVKVDAMQFIADKIAQDANGTLLFGNIEDTPSGKLTVNLAGLTINEQQSEIRLDLRIPVLANKEKMVEQLIQTAKQYHLNYEEFDYLVPLYVPLDSELVQTLMSVYQDKTGDVLSVAKSSGGATFARTMPNCVAFGALFPTTIQTEHQENENTLLEDIYRAMDIYAEAIYRLAVK